MNFLRIYVSLSKLKFHVLKNVPERDTALRNEGSIAKFPCCKSRFMESAPSPPHSLYRTSNCSGSRSNINHPPTKLKVTEAQICLLYDMIYLLTAVGLPPGGSSSVHIYTQTVNRTTQNKQYIEQHKNLGRVRAVPHLCGCYPGICFTTEEKAWKNLSQSQLRPSPRDGRS
jgi:hypothetical protein